MKLYAWKFFIPATGDFMPLPSDPNHSYRGCLAIAVAPTADEARGVLRNYAREMGRDARWLEPGCAKVACIEIDGPAVLGWAMV